ncbi:hypothetical protein vseg_012397 [Gypsophila vaccaria]
MGSNQQAGLLVDFERFVDPFLVEALQNPRHRLTILRMELDIQKFLQNSEQLQFEFQPFPTSYLRLAAHRVAQHYGLQTTVVDSLVDGPNIKILVSKTAETKYPSVCLSEVPAKQPENSKLEQVKIAIRPRPGRTSSGDAAEMERRRNLVRSVEERKEEYDRARARIFSSPSSPTSDETSSQGSADGKALCPSKEENGGCRNFDSDSDKNLAVRDVGNSSRVAIFRDREKDRVDPDYDRSYDRYVKNFPPGQRFMAPFSMPQFQPALVQYDMAFPQMGHIPGVQTPVNYSPSPNPAMAHFCPMGLNQASRDAVYMPWPSPSMVYAHSHDQFRQSFFQAPFCQQPLSFDEYQKH